MILGIIIGILIWNAVCLVVALTVNKDDTAVLISCGIVGLICLLGELIATKIKTFIKGKRFCSVLIDPNGKPCYCKPLRADKQFDVFDKGYHWNENIADKYKPADGWDSFDCIDKNTVNLRYTPIKIAKAEGSYKINLKELLKTP